MHALLNRYHRHLTAVAEQAQDISGRQIELGVQLFPWMGPVAVGLVLLFILYPHGGFDDAHALPLFLPFAALSVAGVCYVCFVFASVGVRQSYERAEAREHAARSPWGLGAQARQNDTSSRLKRWLPVGTLAVWVVVGIALYLTYRFFDAHP